MSTSQHLPIAFKLGGHYEIVKVLGEDDFEILYVVKDLHLGDKQFVLKELFLPAYASRNEDHTLYVMAKSKQFFEQTKKDIIAEIEVLKSRESVASPKLYGYFEENNTLYTIMELIDDSNLSSYLELKSTEEIKEQEKEKETIVEPPVEMVAMEEKKPKSTMFLKVLIVCVLIFLGLGFYGYTVLEKDKQEIKERSKQNSVTLIKEQSTMPHPSLENRADTKNEPETIPKTAPKEIKNVPTDASYIEPDEIEDMIKNDTLTGVPKAEIYENKKELEEFIPVVQEEIPFEEEPLPTPQVIEAPVSNAGSPNFSLGRRIN